MDYCTRLDQITSDFKDAFGSLSDSEINFRPTVDSWSIAQNIDHLMTINRTYFPIFDKLLNGSYEPPFFARFDKIATFFGKTILESVHPDNKKKTKTLKLWKPKSTDFGRDIISKFEDHQIKLCNYISELERADCLDVTISSPGSSLITYKLHIAFEILITHEQRHLNQCKALMKQMEK